jgi:membrane protein YdbS with pleckstrin-like domain
VTWGVAGIFAANLLFMPTYRYFVHRWETTDEAVYSLSGWITREWRIVPVSRIQSIDTVQGPIEQLLGLSTIKVTTASHEGHVKIEGLETPIAEEAVRRLNEIAQATPGDAT